MKKSPVKIAWDHYQTAAARDPSSDETRKARSAYKRALAVARRKRNDTRGA
jgi:hypothetical protein